MERGEKVSRTTIFHELLRPDAAEGYAVPNVDELSSEAQNILGAASDTTGNVSIAYETNAEFNDDDACKSPLRDADLHGLDLDDCSVQCRP